MNKLLCTLFFLAGCTPYHQFSISTANDLGYIDDKNKTIAFVTPQNDIYSARNKKFFQNIYEGGGWTIKEDPAKAAYSAVLSTVRESWQTTGTTPRYGNTTLRSVDTVRYGNVSKTRVDYDYGIVGYDTVINNHFRTCFSFAVYKMKSGKTGDQVYLSNMCADSAVSDDLLNTYIQQIYPHYAESVKSIKCENYDNGNVVCQPN
jgi:hypothetical protein